MRHQIRLLDQDLPGLVRELALACGRALGPRVGLALYRSLYRELRDVLKARVSAFRYCGSTCGCERALSPREGVIAFKHEAYPGERVRVYLTGAESPPDVLQRELGAAATRAVASVTPKTPHGLYPLLRGRIEECLRGRLFASTTCGELPVCSMNEPVDPWERRVSPAV